MPTLEKVPAWQQTRALVLHRAFAEIDELKFGKCEAMETLSRRLHGTELDARRGKVWNATIPTLNRLYGRWKKGGKTPAALLAEYHSGGSHRPLPAALIAEIKRLATMPTGGRDKDGRAPVAPIWKHLAEDWAMGKKVEGLGTWQDWWHQDPRTKGLPLPGRAPEFPFSVSSFRRHVPNEATRKAANIGDAAAKKHLPHLTMDYSRLRRCELYTLDDKRLDFVALEEISGQVTEVVGYFLIECASRSIVAWMIKPAGACRAEDVDELLARGLQTPGYGIGIGYRTHIIFERGTVACSEAAQLVLEGGSGDRIKVHRTGMDGTVRWTGSAADRSSGHANGKGVIESFNRLLDYRLQHLPGQRGNNYQNQPANLGIEDRNTGSQRDSQTKRAQDLGRAMVAARRAGKNVKLELPFLTFTQARAEIEKAVAAHNADPGHDYQGHSHRLEIEVAPGVYVEAE